MWKEQRFLSQCRPASAAARISLRDWRGVITSGSSLSSMMRGLAGGAGALEGGGEILGALDHLAMGAIGAGERREIGIDEVGGDDAAGVVALLMHADGAVHAVVDQRSR